MKTTLQIDDSIMSILKQEAAKQGKTMSEMVESALRALLMKKKEKPKMKPLPTFRSGGVMVDLSDRDALYHAMEGR